MSHAFKCDGCDEFVEATPGRYQLRQYNSAGITGWAGGSAIESMELCDGCSDKIEETVSAFLGSGDDEDQAEAQKETNATAVEALAQSLGVDQSLLADAIEQVCERREHHAIRKASERGDRSA